MSGLGCWLSIACFNNIVDRNTNRHLLGNMFSMELLKMEETLGQGLIYRAWVNKKWTHTILWSVVAFQAIIACMFWTTAILFAMVFFNQCDPENAIFFANSSLMGFILLWVWFLCGGLWFGYWIKMHQVQSTHLLLLIIGLLTILVINIL